MPPALLPDPGPEDPDDAHDDQSPEQGLYITLPAEQLMGIISAARRLESRAAWTLMAAIGEFARRAGTSPHAEFAADELAFELHMSPPPAAGQMDFATDIAKRLPKTFAALRRADPYDPPADHRRGNPHPDRCRRRQGRRDPGGGGSRPDVR